MRIRHTLIIALSIILVGSAAFALKGISAIWLQLSATATNPCPAGTPCVYAKSTDTSLHYVNAAGTDYVVTTTAAGGSGGGTTVSWTTPTFTNSYIAFGAPYASPGYWKDPSGVIHARGQAKSGTNATAVFTFAAGSRPLSQIFLYGYANTTITPLIIGGSTDGTIKAQVGGNTDISFDALSFIGDDVGGGSVSWTAPTFTNSYVNYGAPFANVGYWRDSVTGVVHLRGMAKTGTGATSMFTLPVGSRPLGTIVVIGYVDDINRIITITSTGTITASAGGATDFSLDTISFLGEDSATPATWTAPTFTNSYVNVGAPYTAAGYWKDSYGAVHMRGVISTGTAATSAFTLPVGSRPGSNMRVVGYVDGAVGFILIGTDGTVKAAAGGATNISLDAISFMGEV